MDTIQDEVAPQVTSDKVEKESPDATDTSAVGEKAAEEKSDDASEVGFKKIFRFVGFKFTLKKDKSEEKDPVKLLTVKDKEGEEASKTDEPTKETEEATVDKNTAEEKEVDTETTTAEVIKDGDKAESTEADDEAAKEGGAENEVDTTLPSPETNLSPFRKLFNVGLFSNLRKKASIKKTKEEEEKEVAVEQEKAKTEEPTTVVEEKEATGDVEQESTEAAPETPVEEKTEPKEEAPATPEQAKSDDTAEPEVTIETPAPAESTADEIQKEDEKTKPNAAEEKAPAEVTSEAELLSSQEKAKPQGSPLKKLFTSAGLKKLSTKKQKPKKDTETKLTESEEQAAEQLQSSTDSAEAPKADSGPTSPEDSGEYAIAVEVSQIESSQESHGEVASDGEKKKEGIIAWSSFKKLVTPKKYVKRTSESEDETTGEKPAKSATLSSSESAVIADKSAEEETKEDKPAEEEPKTENTEKLVSSTEEPKKKMDTSVSWEALMCMGGPKKRTRKTSDSDDEETKVEEEMTAAAAEGEQDGKTVTAIVTSQNAESGGELVSSSEPLGSPPDRESAWDTLKRVVMSKNKAKAEEKPGESPEQVHSDSEAPKDESSFSFKKFLPGRRKKKAEKQASTDQGSGEEDSDTPAVVPLSEYNEQDEVEQEVAEAAAVQNKVSAEDRSPSWIPAIVEDIHDKHDELSDIPEEAEAAATPKSVDTDIAEDESPQLPKAPGHTGRRLSTAEVIPVSPVPPAETTPFPQGPKPESAEAVIGGIEVQISAIPPQTSVTVKDVPIEVASEKTEYEPPAEKAECKTCTILEPHTCDEAMAICTGLGTKEISKIALEKPALNIIESVAVISDVISTGVAEEELPPRTEKAIVTEDEILKAQVHQVENTSLEPHVENNLSGVAVIQAANESHEQEIEKLGISNSVVEEFEVVQPATMSENSPKTVVVNSITPTTEAAICTSSIKVTEPTIEVKEMKMEMEIERLTATEENTPVKAVVEAICETTKVSVTEEAEKATHVIVPSEEVPVIAETVFVVAPLSVESNQMENGVTVSEPVSNEAIQVQETRECESAVETSDPDKEKVEEIKVEVLQTSDIEAQSMVIAQNVIQDAMDKVSEDVPEPTDLTTKTATTPTPVQAAATTEKEIEIAETPVISQTPDVVICENLPLKPLCVAIEIIDNIPVEVTKNLDVFLEEEKKPEDRLEKAVEVKVSEETVVAEEAAEIKAEEDDSKEDTEALEPDAKGEAEEVKPKLAKVEEAEEDTEKVVHMPVQVVLQTALMMEEPSVEEEVVLELDSQVPVVKDIGLEAESAASENKLSALSEEPQRTASAEAPAPSEVTGAETEKTSSVKCAEVMAQVIEVIEEAVKEIEPVSAEITAAS